MLTDKGKAVMDQIRTVLTAMTDDEAGLLDERAALTAETADNSRTRPC